MGMKNNQDINLAYFGFQNKINQSGGVNTHDSQLLPRKDGSLDFNLKCSLNFGKEFQQLLKTDTWYIYLTVLSEEADLKGQIYLDQVYGPIPKEIGSISFGAGFDVHVDGKLIVQNSIRSLLFELSITNKTDEDNGFDSAIKDSCFFQTVIPIWSNK